MPQTNKATPANNRLRPREVISLPPRRSHRKRRAKRARAALVLVPLDASIRRMGHEIEIRVAVDVRRPDRENAARRRGDDLHGRRTGLAQRA